jgi:hypothetical protein
MFVIGSYFFFQKKRRPRLMELDSFKDTESALSKAKVLLHKGCSSRIASDRG